MTIKKYSQAPKEYISNFQNIKIEQEKLSKTYIKNYFHVWELDSIKQPIKEAMWGVSYSKRDIYLEKSQKAL